MADEADITNPNDETEESTLSSFEKRKLEMEADLNDPMTIVESVYQIWWHLADFHLFIVSPFIDTITPPVIIKPEVISGTSELEFVYDIQDSGSKLSTSKSEDMVSAGMSMCKLY